MKAAWLGDWPAPWALGRGRRFGDPAWTLAALSRAWLAGGSAGRWPRGRWVAEPRQGPMWVEPGAGWEGLPDPRWVAQLRHGSPSADPTRPARGESPLETWAWEALQAGDAGPWLASGTVHLDLETRLRWVALLGAVDGDGCLQLPPFLVQLVPEGLRRLPTGWWEQLLGAMDAQGRLLPEGGPPSGVPWERLLAGAANLLHPLVLDRLPSWLKPGVPGGWVFPLPGGGWMLDPALRAWGRGWGAAPEVLRTIQAPNFAQGAEASETIRSLLKGFAPSTPPSADWGTRLAADLEGVAGECLPESCGEPTLDRIRVRWGGELPGVGPGYPAWGEQAHPCADPFHWMAEGLRAHLDQDLEAALRAFTLAHAHFQRLGSPRWARRAASNAAAVALRWCDLPGVEAWRRLQGPLPEFYRAHEEAELRAARGEWAEAARLCRRTLKRFPAQGEPWALLGEAGLFLRRREWVLEALEGVEPCPFRELLTAWLGGLSEAAPTAFPPEERLMWACARITGPSGPASEFWAAWDGCRSQLLRLHTGLQVLELHPVSRLPGRLVALQAIADRSLAPLLQARMKALWPALPEAGPEPDPRGMLQALLNLQLRPTWLIWAGKEGRPQHLGHGAVPPAPLLERVYREGGLPPTRLGERLWWGFPLHWEGSRVASALVDLDPEGRMEAPAGVQAMAPWVSQLVPKASAVEPPEPGQLLTDGSEPMAALIRDLDRVAGTDLPVLILGPTGAGKELAARELHRRSGRSGDLVAVNCSAFAETLLESELFGHVKGAFTGAERDRKGAIELAEGGTLFLDEVADLSTRLQSLFLRVLQERELRRVGSEKSRRVDVRFLAATHKSIEDLARSGAFRRDLLYRLQGAVLELPSLEARRHEFPYLLPRLAARAADHLKRPAPPLAPGLAEALARRPWPGNFRELGHALERAILRCGAGPLKPEHFPELQGPELLEGSWERNTRDFQRRLLLATLQRHGFQMTEAAQTLGLTRVALYAAARRLDLDLVLERQRWTEGVRLTP